MSRFSHQMPAADGSVAGRSSWFTRPLWLVVPAARHDVACSARRSVPGRAARRGDTAGARWGGRGRCWPLRVWCSLRPRWRRARRTRRSTRADFHTCAITTAAGTPVCWGYDGDGETTIPPNLGSVTQITAGGYHTCALKTDATPVCWGLNGYGQTTIPQNLGSVTQITAGALPHVRDHDRRHPRLLGLQRRRADDDPTEPWQRHADHRRRLPHVRAQDRRQPRLLGQQHHRADDDPAEPWQRHADHRRRLPHVRDQDRRHRGLLGQQRA